MTEGGEGATITLKPQERAHLQGMAQRVVLGERQGMPVLPAIDRRRFDTARRNVELGRWNQSLEGLQGDSQDVASNLRSLVDKFGVTRSADGTKNRTGAERRRHATANDALTTMIPILESADFDQMPQAQQIALRADVLQRLANNPRLLPEFGNMSPTEQQNLVNRFLRDQNLKQELVSVLRTIQGMSLNSESDILAKDRERVVINTTGRETGRTAGDASTAAGRTEQRLTNLQAGNIPPTPQLNFAQTRFADAEAARNDARDEFNQATTAQTQARSALRTAGGGGNQFAMVNNPALQHLAQDVQDAQERLTTARAARTDAERDFQAASRDLNQAQSTQQSGDREDELEAKLEQQRAIASEARIGAAGTPLEERAKRIELEELREERRLQETSIASRLEGAFGQALERYVINELNSSYQVLEGQEGSVRSEATKAIRDSLRQHLEARWSHRRQRARGIFRRQTNDLVRNRARINQDFGQLLEGNLDDMMRATLRGLRPQDQAGNRAPIDPAEITRLMHDEHFANEFRSDMVKGIVTNRALVRRIRPGELRQMMDMEHVRDVVQHAFNANEEYRNQVQVQVGAGNMDMDDPSFRSRFSRAAWRHPGLLLFPLTTIPWSIIAGVQAAHQSGRDERQTLEDQL